MSFFASIGKILKTKKRDCMKKLYLLSFFITSILILAGCGHTNELAKYNLKDQGVLFRNSVSPDAAVIEIVSENPSGKKNDKDILSVIASVGSEILNETSKSKIRKAVSTDSVADNVSAGLKEALLLYLEIKPVDSINDNPKFIVETTINQCKLINRSSGAFVSVSAESQIIDRATGKVVWDDSESETVPVTMNRNNIGGNSDKIENVLNAIQLSSLSEKQIQRVVNNASKSAGNLMGNTLREDFVKAHQK